MHLAEAMTLKMAGADMPFGGGKALGKEGECSRSSRCDGQCPSIRSDDHAHHGVHWPSRSKRVAVC